MQVIRDLLAYVNDGRVGESLAATQESIGPTGLRVVAIKVLSWLKSQNRLPTKRPLKINMEYPWCANLATLLATNTDIAVIFVLCEDAFDFRAEIAEGTRREILACVDAHYQPPLITLARC